MLKDIRQDTDLARGSPISTKVFLAWIWRRVGLLILIVTVLVALLVIPVAVLWTRDMNHGFKVLLTILLLVFILAASYVTGNAMLYINARGLHLRRDIFGNQGQQARLSISRDFLSKCSLSFLLALKSMVLEGCGGYGSVCWTNGTAVDESAYDRYQSGCNDRNCNALRRCHRSYIIEGATEDIVYEKGDRRGER